jgi:hypothetical protein
MGKRGPWMEMEKAKREQGDAAAAQQMRASRPGACDNCGATVGPSDLIRWDRAARKIAQCVDCGLSICGRLMLSERGCAIDTSANDLRRSRAAELARYELMVPRAEARLARATDEQSRAKATRWLETTRANLADAQREARGNFGPCRKEPAWAVPSARDIELARAAAKAAQEKREREEAEERAAQVADALSPAGRAALRFYGCAGEFRAIGCAPPAELEAGTAELLEARLVRPSGQSYEPTAEGDACLHAA